MATGRDARGTADAGGVVGVAAAAPPRRVVVGAGGGMARVIVEALHADDDPELVLRKLDVRRQGEQEIAHGTPAR